ncbi:hypothetical protein QFZ80_003762 [Paenibacillus sp. V4I7]|nr:hypothetical protein [Paenibacillus sp. V4I7]
MKLWTIQTYKAWEEAVATGYLSETLILSGKSLFIRTIG